MVLWNMQRTKLIFAWVAILAGATVASAQWGTNCTEFGFRISTTCCCTANCCAEALEGEFTAVEDDSYRSNFTGQVVKRTGWSADYRFIRCACDLIEGSWRWHKGAKVNCVYPPLPQG